MLLHMQYARNAITHLDAQVLEQDLCERRARQVGEEGRVQHTWKLGALAPEVHQEAKDTGVCLCVRVCVCRQGTCALTGFNTASASAGVKSGRGVAMMMTDSPNGFW